jgi:hypothetical protein
LLGVISDRVSGPNSMRYGLVALAFTAAWASVHFWLATRAATRPGAMEIGGLPLAEPSS